jgi:dTDP-4-dehydrorhamnose 3,5-epimerase
MRIISTAIPGVLSIRPERYEDARGHFVETYNRRAFVAAGIDAAFVQDNQSLSRRRGTLRGLHFQIPPFAQAKLVRVLRGAILDVVVDLRHGSPSFGRHLTVELTDRDDAALFVPVGCAHGFCTLVDDAIVAYKVSNFYSRDHDLGVRWNDPALAIDWPVGPNDAIVSDKDRALPLLADLPRYFAVG